MIERGQEPRFAREPRQALGVAGKRRWQDLDRHVAPELFIVGAIHLAHAADADEGGHFVDAEAGAWGDGQSVAVNYTGDGWGRS
jgi:hypothetical protein